MDLFPHQHETVTFSLTRDRVYDMSDPGTGKTIAHLTVFDKRCDEDPSRRLIVLCPKSIMYLAWGQDIEKAIPHRSYALAHAENRAAAFDAGTKITVANIDAIKWLAANPNVARRYSDIIIDEPTSVKNRTSDRSKAALKVMRKIHQFEHATFLSGTPNPQGVLDLWHQIYLLDGGQRLGASYFAFQNAVCSPKQTGPSPRHVTWVEKPGMNDVVAELIRDITIRHPDTVLGLPPNRRIMYPVKLGTKHRAMYDTFKREAILELTSGTISTFHAASLRTKILQVLSGAVYDGEKVAHIIDTARYELIADLVEARRACVVPFMWKHQRDEIIKVLTARGLSTTVIDGEVSDSDRRKAVTEFQEGRHRAILIHPNSAAHGLTMTRGTATIWPSPTDNAEFFLQVNKRIDRVGQECPTETIMICGEDTIEEGVYDHLLHKTGNVTDLLGLFTG